MDNHIDRTTAAGERTAATAGRSAGRSTGVGIVVAGDRASSRKTARRHSQAVRGLKIALPLTAVAVAGLFAASILQTAGWGTAIPELAMPQILPENLAMENPHYEGFNADGGRYWVKAARAVQDLQSLGSIKLEGITGELTDAQRVKTRLAAARGTFNNKSNVLELFDTIDINGENGLMAKLTRASVKTKDGIITSDQPVSVAMQAGAITANQMTIRQRVKEYTFVDDVRTTLTPKPSADSATPPSAPRAFGSSDQPIVITSGRLDINDASKTAMFTGQVLADQQGATLSAPELEVTYEGSAVAEPASASTLKTVSTSLAANAAPTPSATSGRLKRIFARSPIELKQATGETVTGRTLEFDALTQKAVVDGDVIVMQLPDRRAVADRAEFDQAADTLLLTGAVVLTQGGNDMRGARMTFNRAQGKMQLTAPTAAGGSGRIFAKFKQSADNKPTAPANRDGDAASGKTDGVAFGASFKTTPGTPINIEAARLDVDDTTKDAVFTGDVRAVQGDFIIKASTLSAKYTGSAGLDGTSSSARPAAATGATTGAAQISRIKARDNVRVTGSDGQTATSDWADFDPKTNMATLGGDVVLTQGKNVVRGTKLVIDMTTGESTIKTEPATSAKPATPGDGTATAESAPQGRPSAVFYPSDMKAKSPKLPKAANGSGWEARSQP